MASVSLDGCALPADRYTVDPGRDLLEIKGPLPAEFKLQCDVSIKPHLNTQLSGLYKSSGVYCTQCEAEGFRRITPMQDRPDVMARFPFVFASRLPPPACAVAAPPCPALTPLTQDELRPAATRR